VVEDNVIDFQVYCVARKQWTNSVKCYYLNVQDQFSESYVHTV